MPTIAAPGLVTAEEFLRDHGDRENVELVRGRIVEIEMQGSRHGEIVSSINGMLWTFVKANQLGRVISNDAWVRTQRGPDTYRGPDVAFVSYATRPKDRPLPAGPLEDVLDLVVEVKSPSDRRKAIIAKAEEYLAAGVKVVVIVDPELEMAVIYRDDEFPLRVHNGDLLTLPDVLPGFSVPVRALFE